MKKERKYIFSLTCKRFDMADPKNGIITDCSTGETLGPAVIARSESDTGDSGYVQFLAVSQQVTCHGVITVGGIFLSNLIIKSMSSL